MHIPRAPGFAQMMKDGAKVSYWMLSSCPNHSGEIIVCFRPCSLCQKPQYHPINQVWITWNVPELSSSFFLFILCCCNVHIALIDWYLTGRYRHSFGLQQYSGLDEAVYRNIEACKELAKTLKSTYGPHGQNKMVINHLDKLFVTNDAATILRELEVW